MPTRTVTTQPPASRPGSRNLPTAPATSPITIHDPIPMMSVSSGICSLPTNAKNTGSIGLGHPAGRVRSTTSQRTAPSPTVARPQRHSTGRSRRTKTMMNRLMARKTSGVTG